MAATDYFLELDGIGSGSPSVSPSPAGSAYHTPRASMSRRPSSRRDISSSTMGSQSPTDGSSPPPMPHYNPGRHDMDKGDVDEDISPLDPRRFTPTLHASLVSEILNLRRELDSKHKFIEDLEISLHSSRNEKDEVSDKLSQVEKDRRSLKRQFNQLETGTLAALEELAKDRDGAKKQFTDVKVKFDDLQEKLKRKEEESDRTHTAWEKEQTTWETERRANERRVHVAETRLKQVVAELEAVHNAQTRFQEQHISEEEDQTRDSGLGDESDTASQASPLRTAHARNMSNSSRMSYPRHRFSVQSLTGADGQKLTGISLADELQLDEEDEDLVSEADSEIHSPEMLAKKGLVSRVSQFFDEKAKRGGLPEPRRVLQAPIELDRPKIFGRSIEPIRPRVAYVDAGVQYDIPAPAVPEATEEIETKLVSSYCDSGVQYEPIEFEDIITPPAISEQRKDSKVDNQYIDDLRKSMATPPALIDRGQQMSPIPSPPKKRISMVESGSQTLDEPLSPPATPAVSPPASPIIAHHTPQLPETKTMSTQTDFFVREEQKSIFSIQSRPPPLTIPSINIVPPPSAPSSPKEPKLPPGTKNADTQTGADLYSTVSVSVQTEEIRIDARLAKLPPHLHPSAVSSNPPTPDLKSRPSVKKRSSLGTALTDRFSFRAGYTYDDPPSSPPHIYAPTPVKKVEIRSASTGTVSTAERVEGLRRLLRSSVLGPPFDGENDVSDREDKSDYSETEQKVPTFSTPNMSSRSLKHLRTLGGTRPSPVPEEKDENDQSPEPLPLVDSAMASTQSFASGRSSMDTNANRDKDRTKSQLTKANSSKLRRSAIVQSGTVAHRSRTPSVASVGSSSYFSSRSVGPPFPVPDRGSSRKTISSRSEGSSSPTPRSGGIFGSRRRVAVPLSRKDSLRKVRSATTIQRSNSRGKSRSRSRSRSPQLEHRLSSPTFPPMPNDLVGAPAKHHRSQKSTDKMLSQRPTSMNKQPGLSRASQGTVVDAIAATMVGEWMWKYVRRRTSFGVPESPIEPIGRPGTDGSVNVTGNGVRHKRWVWLSPYERAIMWSSKQPASNTALMGKSGRKLVIQSVLDVRDDTPLPKNHGISEPFNRSILILTPARALKFTAMSKERHYTWLTALSFLAHSPLLAPGISLPPPPQEPLKQEPPRSRGSGMKRGGIRDSVRIAKDRARPVRPGKADVQSGSIPDIEFEAAFGASAPIPPIPLLPESLPAAEPPSVPRFAHGRNRSLTGPRLPSSNIRSLGYRETPSPSFPISSLPSPSIEYPSTRNSEASSATRNTFLDTVGTIRMEAFIEEHNNNLACYSPPLSVSSGRRYTSATHSPRTGDSKRGGIALADDYEMGGRFDPFKDFNR